MNDETQPVLINTDPEEFLSVANSYSISVRNSLRNPVLGGHTFAALLCEGKPSPDWGIFLNGFTLDQARELMSVVKLELCKLETEQPFIKIDPEIDTSINGKTVEEDHFSHELEHIKMAKQLGVSLAECTLQFYAEERILSGTIGIQVFFTIPFNTDPTIAARITLAPQWLSGTDINSLMHIIKTNRIFFLNNPIILEELDMIFITKRVGPNNDGEKPESLKIFL